MVLVLYFIYGASMTKRYIKLETNKMSGQQFQTFIISLRLDALQWRRKVGATIKIVDASKIKKNRKEGL